MMLTVELALASALELDLALALATETASALELDLALALALATALELGRLAQWSRCSSPRSSPRSSSAESLTLGVHWISRKDAPQLGPSGSEGRVRELGHSAGGCCGAGMVEAGQGWEGL